MQQGIDQTVQQNAFENGSLIIRISAVFLIVLSVIVWFAASFSKKMKARNELAIKTDKVIHEIIQDYELILQEEEREIIELKNKLS
jgi:heme/copper-type cytochrome/quinol oxidase subunit 2